MVKNLGFVKIETSKKFIKKIKNPQFLIFTLFLVDLGGETQSKRAITEFLTALVLAQLDET